MRGRVVVAVRLVVVALLAASGAMAAVAGPVAAAGSAGAGVSVGARPEGTRLEGLAAGYAHSCALTGDGGLRCWGSDAEGQVTVPAGGPWVAVAAGLLHTCGLSVAGAVTCWGSNTYGQAASPAGSYTAVSAGDAFSCALAVGGAVHCWGVPGMTGDHAGPYTAVASGSGHVCALTVAGHVECWGSDAFGQTDAPVAGVFTAVVSGGRHSCGIHPNGTVQCWGDNAYGQAPPTLGSETFRSLSGGSSHTCGVTTASAVVCFGNNGFNQTNPPVGVTFTSVAAGLAHTCGLTTQNTIDCWGANTFGQATDQIGGFRTPAVAAGYHHSCALTVTGTIDCWGEDTHGESNPPAGTFTSISAGVSFSCAVSTAGGVACWGRNDGGQASPPAGAFTSVSAGSVHACGVTTAGWVACWGGGNGAYASPPGGTFLSVSVHNAVSCGITTASALTCWGSFTPTFVGPAPSFSSVSVGEGHVCAVTTAGTVLCWAYNGTPEPDVTPGVYDSVSAGPYGACGLASAGTVTCWASVPLGLLTPPAGTFTAVSVGDYFACGVTTAGSVACWGTSSYGRTGGVTIDPTPPSSPSAVGASYSSPFATVPPPAGMPGESTVGVPVSWSVVAGVLPSGLVLDPVTGVLAGSPSSVGSFSFTVGASSVFPLATQEVTVVVEPRPAAPTGVVAAAGNGQATVSWVASVPNGSALVTGYEVHSFPEDKVCVWAPGPLSCTVSGLTNGTGYTFTVVARNAVSSSVPSVPSAAVTPLLGSDFHPLAPTRVLDSRNTTGGWNGPLVAGVPRSLVVAGVGSVPVGATAVVANVTVTGGSANSFLTVYPAGGVVPNASNVNFAVGETVPNLVTVKVGAGGAVEFANAVGSVQVVVDVVGYYDTVAGDRFNALAPVRVLDSRTATGGWGAKLDAGTPRPLVVRGVGGVPVTADAVVVNVTVTGASANSFVTVFPAGGAVPNASNVNFAVGQTVPNLVTVKVGAGGAIAFANAVGSVEVIADVVGFYDPTQGDVFHPVDPARLLDSRTAVGGWGSPLGGSFVPRALTVAGPGVVPAFATAVVGNTTVTGGTANSFVTVFPAGGSVPNASNVNFAVGQTVSNLTAAKVGTNGQISFANAQGTVQVIFDAVGYFTAT